MARRHVGRRRQDNDGASGHWKRLGACHAWKAPGRLVSTKPGVPKTGLAGGTACGRPVAAPAHRRRHGEKQRRERDGDGGECNLVNKLKSKIQFINSVFSFFLASNEKLLNTKLA